MFVSCGQQWTSGGVRVLSGRETRVREISIHGRESMNLESYCRLTASSASRPAVYGFESYIIRQAGHDVAHVRSSLQAQQGDV